MLLVPLSMLKPLTEFAATVIGPSNWRREEVAQFFGSSLRNLLGEKMTSIKRLASHVICPTPPQRQRAALLGVPGVQWSLAAPEHKHWTGDAAPGLSVRRIVLVIECRRRSIFLANRVNARGITQRLDILRPSAWGDDPPTIAFRSEYFPRFNNLCSDQP
jgi:hypothetical protein